MCNIPVLHMDDVELILAPHTVLKVLQELIPELKGKGKPNNNYKSKGINDPSFWSNKRCQVGPRLK